jgi:hypothetical protein
MTLDEMLLQKLVDWRPDAAQPSLEVHHPASGWKVRAAAEAVDTLGCRLHEVVLARTTPRADAPPLAEQAGRIARRVSGLLEPLRLVEVDEGRAVAQLRSGPPARRGETTQYYEVLRSQDGATRLGRYETGPAGPRRPVAFTLTHEALAKVVADLAAE